MKYRRHTIQIHRSAREAQIRMSGGLLVPDARALACEIRVAALMLLALHRSVVVCNMSMTSRLIILSLVLGQVSCQPTQKDRSQPETIDPLIGARMKMVKEQLIAPGRDIRDPLVLKAMETVPRHEFVPASQRSNAYEDYPLPIGHGQTISQPFIVAFMTEKLRPQPEDRVLEIGTGSGYQAAVLACVVKEVYSIEIVEPLARQATETLQRLGYTNVWVKAGDGYQGWPEHAPFDAIIVTCAPDHIPQPLVDQLREGGRMIIPVGGLPNQELYLLEKEQGRMRQTAVLPVRFVPMTGQALKPAP